MSWPMPGAAWRRLAKGLDMDECTLVRKMHRHVAMYSTAWLRQDLRYNFDTACRGAISFGIPHIANANLICFFSPALFHCSTQRFSATRPGSQLVKTLWYYYASRHAFLHLLNYAFSLGFVGVDAAVRPILDQTQLMRVRDARHSSWI